MYKDCVVEVLCTEITFPCPVVMFKYFVLLCLFIMFVCLFIYLFIYCTFDVNIQDNIVSSGRVIILYYKRIFT
jgi:hypothetical protein